MLLFALITTNLKKKQEEFCLIKKLYIDCIFQCIYGSYVHSAILPTFHRRCYWLLQVGSGSFGFAKQIYRLVQVVLVLLNKSTGWFRSSSFCFAEQI